MPNSVAVIDPAKNKVVADVNVGVDPDAVTAGSNAVWVANVEDETVSRIDPQTRRLVGGAIHVDDNPADLAVGRDDLWVALGSSTRRDPRTGRGNAALKPIPALGGDSVRQPDGQHRLRRRLRLVSVRLRRTSAASTRTPASAPRSATRPASSSSASSVSPFFADVAFGLERLWIVNRAANAVIELDAGRVVRTITVGPGPVAIAVGEGSLWVACFDDDTVWRIDIPGPGQPATPTSIPVGDGPADVAVGEDAVWVVNRKDAHRVPHRPGAQRGGRDDRRSATSRAGSRPVEAPCG